jgi:hypothetical protein
MDDANLNLSPSVVDLVHQRAQQWGCHRVYLTSEPDNLPAYAAWTSRGFTNTGGDYTTHGIAITKDLKGPGKDRAVFELLLP